MNVGRDRAEVFGDDWQFTADCTLQRVEEVAARSLDPATALRGLVFGGHFPSGGEAAEVVEAHNVRHLQSLAHALDPPLETVLAHTLPVVDRVAPELTRLAEGVGRDSC